MSTREVSTMIKQGFISDPHLSFSPSRTLTTTFSRLYSPSSSPPPQPSPPSPPPPAQQKQQPPTQLAESNQSINRTNQGQSSHHHPTLFEMMSQEQLQEAKRPIKSQSRIVKLLSRFKNPKNELGYMNLGSGDVRLTVVGKDGFRVCVDVHKKVLAEKSRFFAEKLARRDRENKEIMHMVEISECDDVEVYLEIIILMYCDDMKKRLLGEDLDKVLALLKVSAAIMFDTGIMSCLEYLEAAPWSEDEEEKVISHLSQLDLIESATEVLQRVTSEPSTSSRADDIFVKLLSGVLQAKDDKARREMKSLVSRLLREDSSDYENNKLDVSRETLYGLCHRCVSSLVLCLSEATSIHNDIRQDRGAIMTEIGREADNIQWIVDILIDKRMCDDFVKLWADQKELATLHSKIPTMYRHEISRITAQLCIAIGRGYILVPKDTRFCLLSTWLEALYEDFAWMKRASRSIDKKLIEDGLSQTILTLPLLQQQAILLNWFDRFLNKGCDCPNIQKAFEVWWRRAFIRQYALGQENSHLQITVFDYPK